MSKAQSVNLKDFSREDLIELNRRICNEIDFLGQKVKAAFSVGDSVQFRTRQGKKVVGSILKINKKNIKMLADDGFTRWNVSPSLLKKV